MSAVLARRPTRSIPVWVFMMIVGFIIDAIALTSLVVLRSPEAGGLDSTTRAVLSLSLAIGTTLFTIGLGIPMLAMVARAGTSGGATLGSYRVVLGTTLLVILISNVPPTIFGLATSVTQLRTVQGFFVAALSVELTLIAAAYWRLIRSGETTWRGLGFDFNRVGPDIIRGIGYGVGAFAVSAVMQAILDLIGVRQTQLHELSWIRDLDLTGFLIVFALGAFGAPLAEELYFRGYVFAASLREKGPIVAYLLSGAVFASLHLNKEALLPIFVLGMMLAWMYRRSNSIIPPIVAHALNNGLAFLIFYFGPTLGQ